MVKHRKYKSVCKASAKVVGNHVTMTATCPVKMKVAHVKPTKKAVRRKPVTEVPASCKGLKKQARKKCAKRVCKLRPREYRQECYKKAGIR